MMALACDSLSPLIAGYATASIVPVAAFKHENTNMLPLSCNIPMLLTTRFWSPEAAQLMIQDERQFERQVSAACLHEYKYINTSLE